MGWYTNFQGDVQVAAAQVLWFQPFGCKVFASTAAVEAWLWAPLPVMRLRMWSGCKAAQGLDFHDYLPKTVAGLTEHFSNIAGHAVALGIVLESCLTYFQYNSKQLVGCVTVTALLPLLAASTPNRSFPFQPQLWRPARPQRDIQNCQVKEHVLVPLNFSL